ncbi:DUF4391 domain-containing protein [Zhihengliuella sp.]|uniref:DUF4391 domain-containing protein n=1 Tax=Zhihengliuella sp. TaxID=1954483 RepID=UPI0028111533|nr:DUF4391 domain-containing protein [Zhihengliuella sp.]
MTGVPIAQLFDWPPAAKFGRRVPKEMFYKHGTVSATVRERFVSEVASIEWAFKLAESTINLPGTEDLPEVQVFRIKAKHEDVAKPVLAAIDAAVPHPILFEILRTGTRGEEGRMAAAARKSRAFHSTVWVPGTTPRTSLPTAISLDALYAQLLETLLPVTGRIGETPEDLAERASRVNKLERDVAAMRRRLRNEPQFNRKLELRRALKALQAELEDTRK